jgi:ADP-heptose:LPS heptosyltransferase
VIRYSGGDPYRGTAVPAGLPGRAGRTAGRAGVHRGSDLHLFHQSPLPTALLLRLAGVPRIAAISEDYPGSLLDVRHRSEGDVPEPERALGLARAAGFDLPPGDDGKLAVRRPLPAVGHLTGPGRNVLLHPGASAPARRRPAERWVEAVAALAGWGRQVVLTGSAAERELTAAAAGTRCYRGGDRVIDLGGRTSLAELAAVAAGADAGMVANTGVAHLPAADLTMAGPRARERG